MKGFLLEPYRLGFMSRALAEVVLLGALGAVVGVHVALRRLAFVTEAVQHTVFPGIAIAFAAGWPLLPGAAIAAALTVGLLVALTSDRRVARLDVDSALALSITSFFAVGVVVVSRRTGYAADLNALLFGRILDVSRTEVVETAVIAGLCLVVLGALHKELVLLALDRTQAAAVGLPVAGLDAVLYAVTAATVVVAVRAIGTVLVVAFVVTPAAAGRLLTRTIPQAMAVAAILAAALGWVALSTSYDASLHHDVRLAAGATVVVAYTLAFAAAGAGRVLLDRRLARRAAGTS
ncbi:MAG TPA: metal ABC transporter permease [Acidimicrobiia bacterium]|nr:metal ABC transporter permease [Acidimicrobiia bacterium]